MKWHKKLWESPSCSANKLKKKKKMAFIKKNMFMQIANKVIPQKKRNKKKNMAANKRRSKNIPK